MLPILNVEHLNEDELNIVRKRSKKTKIFLYDTQRRFDDFVMKIKYRRNGKYDDIPHFIIAKTGDIYKVFDTKYSSNTFNDPNNDKKLIKVAIENLGWLKKNTITGILNNWVNDPYRIEPFIKGWRGSFFWDRYTDNQLDSVVSLCRQLCEDHKIPYQTVPSQGYIENLSKFEGIVCKSNYGSIYKDTNLSFDFKRFYEHTEANE